MKSLSLSICCLVFLFACGTAQKTASSLDTPGINAEKEAPTNLPFKFPYLMSQPDMAVELPPELAEISGLSITSSNEICAVQDENGTLFYLDREDGRIVRSVDWHKDGDYEGVECVGDKVYVVKSNGKLFELSPTNTDTLERVLFRSALCKKNDIEGLSYDSASNRLMLACKGKSSDSGEDAMKCDVFSFCLNAKKVDTIPAFSLGLNKINKFIESMEDNEQLEAIKEFFADKDKLKFAPSAMAIHPISSNLYLVSSKGKMLIVVSQEKEILHIEKLRKKIHAQPEGLAFDSIGALFISSESKKEKPAVLYRFDYKQ